MRFMKAIGWGAAAAVLVGGVAYAQENTQPKAEKGKALRVADTNGDGQVSFEELSKVRPQMTQERFAKLDRNGDGFLSKADRAEATKPKDSAKSKDADKPVDKEKVAVAVEAVRAADKDLDGKVTFEELSAAKPQVTKERYAKMDRNKDGVLSMADAAAAHSGDKKGQDARQQAVKKLAEADANKDGRTTYEEVVAAKPGFPRAAFDRLDANKDGALAGDEMAKRATPSAQGPDRAERRKRLEAADTDKDGKVSLDEATKAFPKMTPEMFKKMDKNGDGFLGNEGVKPS